MTTLGKVASLLLLASTLAAPIPAAHTTTNTNPTRSTFPQVRAPMGGTRPTRPPPGRSTRHHGPLVSLRGQEKTITRKGWRS